MVCARLLSTSSHKLYGPKGVGALYMRGGPYALPVAPLMIGGGQERKLRPGTLNVPGVMGFGEACDLCQRLLSEESVRIAALWDRLEEVVLNADHSITRNGALGSRLAGNSSLTFSGIDADALVINTPDVAISTGSACTSGAPEPSHVLLAVGLSREEANSSVCIGVGRFTTEDDISRAASSILGAYDRISQMRV